MQLKSKILKKWNLPSYGVRLGKITSKPYPILIAFLGGGVILILVRQPVFGIAVCALSFYQLCIGHNDSLCEFYDQYVVFYSPKEPDDCYIMFWEDVAEWKYHSGVTHDTLHVLLKDGQVLDFSSLSRRKTEHFFRRFVPQLKSSVHKQQV